MVAQLVFDITKRGDGGAALLELVDDVEIRCERGYRLPVGDDRLVEDQIVVGANMLVTDTGEPVQISGIAGEAEFLVVRRDEAVAQDILVGQRRPALRQSFVDLGMLVG